MGIALQPIETPSVIGANERRLFGRIPLDVSVYVSVAGRVSGWGRIRDLGLGGAFIDAGDLELYPNDIARILFPGGVILRARVTRHAAGGLGLMFRDHDRHSLDRLRILVETLPGRVLPMPRLGVRH